MTERRNAGGLQVAQQLFTFLEAEAIPGTGVDSAEFWAGFGQIVADLAPVNRALLDTRDRIQAEIDAWCKAHRGQPFDMPAYKAFLTEIGYLVPEGDPFSITADRVDDEIAVVAGPLLVVPVAGARDAV